MRRAKAVVFHSLDQALAAMRAAEALGVPLTLMSGPGAAGYAGPAWFAEVLRQARAQYPTVKTAAILDCAQAPGRALGALRHGVKRIRLAGNALARARVVAIAKARGAVLDGARYELLDLNGARNPERAAREFLESKP